MKFFTNKVKYSILAGLAAYGTYHLALNFIGIGFAIQNCHRYSEGTISVVCYLFGLS
ncbi:MAG: hypothetical protein OEM28_10255 [Nitrosopumilus sp.]|nr:hypothetical protein [Nitrosopumilus sp.]